MNKTFTVFLRKAFSLFVIFSLTLLFSCKKDGKLTPNFDDGNLAISYVDTFSIATAVEKEDSLRTDALLLNMIGLFHDSIFGPVSSSFYTQVKLTGVDLEFNTPTTIVDSIVLTLAYAGLHGNATSPMSVEVYELDEELDPNTDYYSSSTTPLKPTPLANNISFVPNTSDSVSIAFDTIIRQPHLRIKLDNAFGDAILAADPSDLIDDASFSNFMKGLHIKTSENVNNTTIAQNEGSILSINMNSELSTLTMYYDDTSSYSFTINSTTEKYSHFEQNYTGTDVEKHLNNDASKNISRTYVSSLAGVKTKIDFPTIKELNNDGPVLINKAEITFTVEPGTDSENNPVDKTLYLVGIDADGNQIVLPDNNSLVESDPAHFGGTYDNGTYTFNITRYLHQVLTSSNPDYGLFLVSEQARTEANRVVLGSGEKTGAYKMRLEITYSKI